LPDLPRGGSGPTTLSRRDQLWVELRMALGAGRNDVLRLVLNRALRLVGVGLGLGCVFAIALAAPHEHSCSV
jgi:hypothetical protein